MTAYYNEHDVFAADWLRNLIKEGLIADGEVDTRSIVDVRPGDLSGFEQCHFFAGIGGWSYALRMAGWADDRAVWTGSCPCQPFSLAGAQKGFADERHLWPIWRELIREFSPSVVFGEQVASATAWLGLVRGDLEALGYAVGAIPIQAASAGADHLRDRYWFVADADGFRSDQINPDARGRGNGSSAEQGAGPRSPRHGSSLADADQLGASEERQQRSRQQRGAGCDPEPCDSGRDVADADSDTPGTGRRNTGEVRGVSEAQCEPEHGPALSGGSGDELCWVLGADGKARRVKSGIRLLAHGVPNRVGLLRGFGNAIDKRPAKEFIQAYMSAHPGSRLTSHDRKVAP